MRQFDVVRFHHTPLTVGRGDADGIGGRSDWATENYEVRRGDALLRSRPAAIHRERTVEKPQSASGDSPLMGRGFAGMLTIDTKGTSNRSVEG